MTSTPDVPADARIDELMAEHGKPVLAYAHAILRDHHASEDVLQETMLRAWQHRARLHRQQGSVRGWLLTVARNLAFDRLRSAASRHEQLSADGEVPEAVPADRGHPARASPTREVRRPPGHRAEHHARLAQHTDHAELLGSRDEVSALLARLTPAHRAVLTCTYLVGLDVRQTAAALGVPPGTVKSRRHYALSELRRVAVAG
jgi:RNA polymerase sigma-70 factor, ECF subfamily